MLLHGCVHHALGEFEHAITLFREIISTDPTYVSCVTYISCLRTTLICSQVEAICNLGTTYKSVNRIGEARRMWVEALDYRPTYWNALVKVILNRHHCKLK